MRRFGIAAAERHLGQHVELTVAEVAPPVLRSGQQVGKPIQFGGVGTGFGGQGAQPGVDLADGLRVGAAGQLGLVQPQPAVRRRLPTIRPYSRSPRASR